LLVFLPDFFFRLVQFAAKNVNNSLIDEVGIVREEPLEFSMKKFLASAAAGIFAVTLAQSAAAATIEFDFDGETANAGLVSITVGTTVFSVLGTGGQGANLFDTTDPVSSDHDNDDDIIPLAQGDDGVGGNVLILQSDKDGGGRANDFAGGGDIVFTLESGPSLALIGFAAIDDGTFSLSTSLDGPVTALSLSEKETGSTSFLSSFLKVGDSFTINYSGSGAIDTLVFEEMAAVPVPASLPLLLAGLGGLGYLKRRRKA
jgi:hypothetical protein